MNIATIEGAGAAIDPALLVLVSGLGGVFITVVAGFVGAWVQARRDHANWLRERRYEAFVAMTVILRRWNALHSLTEKQGVDKDIPKGVHAKMSAVLGDLPDATSPLLVLGPDHVFKAASEFTEAIHTLDREATKAAEHRLRVAMRKVLGIPAKG